MHVTLDLSLFEAPDLVFALPLIPEGHGSTRGRIATVGEIDVEAGVMDKNAKGEGLLACDRLL